MFLKVDNPLSQCNLKFDNDSGEFEGYASVFGGNDAVNDTIEKGAFSQSLEKGERISMFVNHNSMDVPVGDWVELSEDDTGLHAKGRIDLNHRDGPTVYSALKRSAMDALSIGFRMNKGDFEEKDDGGRIIKNLELKEISIVNFPADNSARIAVVKSDIDSITSLRDAEQLLRDSGFSKSMAIAFVSQLKNVIRSDSEAVFKEQITELKARLQGASQFEHLLKTLRSLNHDLPKQHDAGSGG